MGQTLCSSCPKVSKACASNEDNVDFSEVEIKASEQPNYASTSPSLGVGLNQVKEEEAEQGSTMDIIEKLKELHRRADGALAIELTRVASTASTQPITQPCSIDYQQIGRDCVRRWLETKLSYMLARQTYLKMMDAPDTIAV
jgi:hypothetical protein